jgi:uncharacterized membrane protein YfcA
MLSKVILFSLLGLLAGALVLVWIRARIQATGRGYPSLVQCLVGLITDFLDTLGIGSYAVTTTLYRLWHLVPDEKIPGTMNVGHALPTVVQACIYITIIQVDVTTLVLLIGASVAGAWLGAGIVTRLPRRRIQIGMGVALLIAAGLFLARAKNWLPAGGQEEGLSGALLLVALVGNLLFGALMTIGVGAYAPIMIMVSLLGMHPKAAFPIMMGSCAFLMPIAGIRFIRQGAFDSRAALGLTLGGVPAVLLAALIVKELSLDVVRWLVIVVVIYTAISMLWAALKGSVPQEADETAIGEASAARQPSR